MKKPGLILILFFMAKIMFSQPVCTADSLRYFEGKVITVCSNVTSTFVAKQNKTTFITFGDLPAQKFTVIIFPEDLKNFSYTPAEFLQGREVCIIGDVRMTNGGIEIIVESEEQILLN